MKKYFTLLLATFVLTGYAHAQTILKGKVTDEKGEALIGASVYLKGTSFGASTDIDGNFRLSLPAGSENGTLVISAIGYGTQEVNIGGRSEININLREDSETLNEVVVTGYTAEQRGNIMGAVSTVKTDEMLKVTVPTLDQALQGRVPGVVVTQNTGAPGEGVSIRVRGVGSINSGNYPLYVVDGVPTLDINSFSLQDVVDFNILKDASAAALYGSRAANGVVIITTKSGKGETPKIQINSQFGIQKPTRLIDMANTDEYVKIYNEAATTDNIGKSATFIRPLISEAVANTFDDVDYVKEIMRDAMVQSHSISISGSEGKTNYYLSGSYYNQEGLIKSSDFERLTGKINIDTQVKEWFSTGINLNLAKSTTNLIPSSGDGAGGNGGSVVRYAFFRTPGIPIYDEDGNYTDLPDLYPFLGDGYSPVGMLAYNQNERINNRLFGKTYLKFTLAKGLTLVSNFGIDLNYNNQRRFDRNWGTNNRINNPNRLVVTDTKFQGLTYSNFLTYEKTWGDHNFTFLAGTEAIKNSNYGISSTDGRFPDQKRDLVYLGNGVGDKSVNEGRSGSALLSYFGKVSYGFMNKYFASATIRRDGSSRFGPKNRWGTFYAGNLGWRIDKEAFLVDNTWIDNLYLRAGYGKIGNQEISDYPSIAKVGTSYYYPYGNLPSVGYAVNQLGNTDVKWESSDQFNAGIDLGVLNGSIQLSVDYFHKVTSDLLVNQPIASSSGTAAPAVVNNGKVLNRGIEAVLTYTKRVSDFQFSVSANIATLHNEVLEVNPVIQGGSIGSDNNITLIEKGYPIGSFYLYEMEGIFQSEVEIVTSANQGDDIEPGDVKYKNQNTDNIIDGKDRVHAGSPIPDFTAGLNISMNYKNFDLSIFFQGAYGQEIFSVLNRDIEGFYRAFNVTQRYYDNRWTGPGSTNEYPRASWDASGNNNMFSTRFLEDGSYTRLKNVQLGYSIPPAVIQRLGFSGVRVYVSGTNLLTFTKYQGMDPEMTVSDNALGQGERAAGMDWGTYPSARSFNMGINLTF